MTRLANKSTASIQTRAAISYSIRSIAAVLTGGHRKNWSDVQKHAPSLPHCSSQQTIRGGEEFREKLNYVKFTDFIATS